MARANTPVAAMARVLGSGIGAKFRCKSLPLWPIPTHYVPPPRSFCSEPASMRNASASNPEMPSVVVTNASE